MLFKIGDYFVNIDACRIHGEKEGTSIMDVKFNEHDTMCFVNHINAYICTYNETAQRNKEFTEIFDQLASYGYFGKDLQELYSK